MNDSETVGTAVLWRPALVIGSAFLAVVMMLILVLEQRSELRLLSTELEATALGQLHANARQRLVGSQIDLPALPANIHDDVRVVWVFDPAECHACIHEVNRWNRAILGEYPSGLVIMTNMTEPAAHEIAEAMGIRTAYTADESSDFRAENGLYFDSSFLIINDHGRVVYAEFHDGYQECARDVLALARELVGPEPAPSGSSEN